MRFPAFAFSAPAQVPARLLDADATMKEAGRNRRRALPGSCRCNVGDPRATSEPMLHDPIAIALRRVCVTSLVYREGDA